MFAVALLLFNCPLAFGAVDIMGAGVAQGFDHATNSIVYESIPRYVKLKYKLLEWFEAQGMCSKFKASSDFEAWDAYKSVMAAAPAITTPDHGIFGNRTLEVEGFNGVMSSSTFTCQRTAKELKARTSTSNVKVKIDNLVCAMSAITLYKVHPGFVGLRFEFSSCTGTSAVSVHSVHAPRSAAMNMQVVGGGAVDTGLESFFTAVCASGPAANLNTETLLLPTKGPCGFAPHCAAHTAEASHVIGKGCYQDFIWFDLNAYDNTMAKVHVANLANLEHMIPGVQHLPDKTGFVGPAPVPVPAPAPGNPCTTAAPVAGGRRLQGESPCATNAPPVIVPPAPASDPCKPEGPCAPVTLPPSPPPPATCAQLVCPTNWAQIANPAGVPCDSAAGCTQSDVMKCCTPPSDPPGVVVSDRVCLYFKGILGCNNKCVCSNIPTTPAPSVNDTKISTKPPHPEFCHDCWVQNLIIAAVSWWLSWHLCINGILKRYLLPIYTIVGQKKASAWSNGQKRDKMAATMLAASVAQGQFLTANMGAEGAPGQCRTISQETYSDGWKIIRNAFFYYLIATFLIVHGVWGIWYFIAGVVMDKGWDSTWNCIYIWECPATLCAVWLAIWLMLWLVSWAMAWVYSSVETQESKAGFAYELEGVAGGGGGGAGVLATVAASIGLGGRQSPGPGYA
jgi:hypothetical protein